MDKPIADNSKPPSGKCNLLKSEYKPHKICKPHKIPLNRICPLSRKVQSSASKLNEKIPDGEQFLSEYKREFRIRPDGKRADLVKQCDTFNLNEEQVKEEVGEPKERRVRKNVVSSEYQSQYVNYGDVRKLNDIHKYNANINNDNALKIEGPHYFSTEQHDKYIDFGIGEKRGCCKKYENLILGTHSNQQLITEYDAAYNLPHRMKRMAIKDEQEERIANVSDNRKKIEEKLPLSKRKVDIPLWNVAEGAKIECIPEYRRTYCLLPMPKVSANKPRSNLQPWLRFADNISDPRDIIVSRTTDNNDNNGRPYSGATDKHDTPNNTNNTKDRPPSSNSKPAKRSSGISKPVDNPNESRPKSSATDNGDKTSDRSSNDGRDTTNKTISCPRITATEKKGEEASTTKWPTCSVGNKLSEMNLEPLNAPAIARLRNNMEYRSAFTKYPRDYAAIVKPPPAVTKKKKDPCKDRFKYKREIQNPAGCTAKTISEIIRKSRTNSLISPEIAFEVFDSPSVIFRPRVPKSTTRVPSDHVVSNQSRPPYKLVVTNPENETYKRCEEKKITPGHAFAEMNEIENKWLENKDRRDLFQGIWAPTWERGL